jgi:hypothetical protein
MVDLDKTPRKRNNLHKNNFSIPPLPKQRNKHCVDPMRSVQQVASPDPIIQFDIDLVAEIQRWKGMGDNISVGIDMIYQRLSKKTNYETPS